MPSILDKVEGATDPHKGLSPNHCVELRISKKPMLSQAVGI